MGTYISFMRNQSLWTCSKYSELKLKLNSARKLSVSDLTVVGVLRQYDGSGEQRPGSFADFLEEYGIVPQYILNRVPTKAATKILYELWTGRKPSLKHFHI